MKALLFSYAMMLLVGAALPMFAQSQDITDPERRGILVGDEDPEKKPEIIARSDPKKPVVMDYTTEVYVDRRY